MNETSPTNLVTDRNGSLSRSSASAQLAVAPYQNPTEVSAYAKLQREIHDALRAQHPEWVRANGDYPTCDSYESRFAELLHLSLRPKPVTVAKPNKRCDHPKEGGRTSPEVALTHLPHAR
jgi:hypothetical protein